MQTWIDQLEIDLGEEPVSSQDAGTLLEVARDVAHRVERKVTPLSAFLLGLAVGRSMAGGTPRPEALGAAVERLRASLPEPG